MPNYESYFNIDKRFNPQIDKAQIESQPDLWKEFYPHESFVSLIKTTIDILNRAKRLSVWVEGAYGTGKSHAVLTLKKLLEATPKDAEEYFVKPENADLLGRDLYNQFDAAKRSGKILVVHRYGSSSIKNDDQLVLAMQESITDALQNAGMINPGRSMKAKMIEWLSNPNNAQWMNNNLKSEWRAMFDGRDVNTLLSDLNTYSGDNLQLLMSRLMTLPIPAFRLSIEDLLNWIKDIIRDNDLKTFLFIWDEFTEYFQNNRLSITGFQNIAELSASDNFYMMIVTHKSGELFKEGDDSKKILDRFIKPTCHIELPEHMAFKLIARALKKNPAMEREWNALVDDLYTHTRNSRKQIMDRAHVDDSDLKAILPLHPYTAITLKHISTNYQSNQRSMFSFIKDDSGENAQAFQWFIKTHGPNDGLFLVDMLWNFFYEHGKQNLNPQTRGVLSYFDQTHLNDPMSQRVLKAVLLLQAIASGTNNADIFMPTLDNIRMVFDGCDELPPDMAQEILNELTKTQILIKKKSKNNLNKTLDVYNARQTALSNDDIDKKRDELRQKTTTESLLPDISKYTLKPELRNRFKIACVSQDTFKRRLEQLNAEKGSFSNTIDLIIAQSKTDEEMLALHQSIRDEVARLGNNLNVVIALSAKPFGADRLDQYIDAIINEEAHRGKDRLSADKFRQDQENCKTNWYADILASQFNVYSKEDPASKRAESFDDMDNILKDIVRRRYQLAPELYFKVTEALWKDTNIKLSALCAIKRQLSGLVDNKNPKLNLKEQLIDIWNDNEYWNHSQSNDACQMVADLKKAADDQINKKFASNGKVSFEEIYSVLERAPYGLQKCNLTSFLFGFILKDYVGTEFAWSNGSTSDKLDETKLAISIESFFRNRDNLRSKPEYIVKDKEEIRLFCEATTRVFDISYTACNNIDNARTSIREKMKNLYCPIWTLKYALKDLSDSNDMSLSDSDRTALIELIDNYTRFANNNNTKETDNDLATKIGLQFKSDRTPIENLRTRIAQKDVLKKALQAYIAQYESGELCKIAERIGDRQANYIELIRQRIRSSDANWLWYPETLDKCIQDNIFEYQVILLSRPFVPQTTRFDETMNAWRSMLQNLHIPYAGIQNMLPQNVRALIDLIITSKERHWNNDELQNFIEILKSSEDEIRDFFTAARQLDFFCKINQMERYDLSDAEIRKIFDEVPGNQFYEAADIYRSNIQKRIEDHKNRSAAGKLAALWKDKTHTSSPREWSQKFNMPLLAMLDDSIRETAERHFNTINSHSTESRAVREATEFIQNATFFEDIANTSIRDQIFKDKILGKYGVLLNDFDAVRNELSKITDPSRWDSDPRIQKKLDELAQKQYKTSGSARAIERIDSLPPEDLKKYLKQLITDNMTVGIEIISQ